MLPALAHSAAVICGDTSVHTDATPTVKYYYGSIEASLAPACSSPYTQYTLTKSSPGSATVAAQTTLWNTVAHKYLKVSAGLMVEMSGGEKASVDTGIQNAQQPAIDAGAEVSNNPICQNHTLAQISTYWDTTKQGELQATITTLDTAIAALSAGAPKTAITAARNAIVAHMTMYIDHEELVWRYICSLAVH